MLSGCCKGASEVISSVEGDLDKSHRYVNCRSAVTDDDNNRCVGLILLFPAQIDNFRLSLQSSPIYCGWKRQVMLRRSSGTITGRRATTKPGPDPGNLVSDRAADHTAGVETRIGVELNPVALLAHVSDHVSGHSCQHRRI